MSMTRRVGLALVAAILAVGLGGLVLQALELRRVVENAANSRNVAVTASLAAALGTPAIDLDGGSGAMQRLVDRQFAAGGVRRIVLTDATSGQTIVARESSPSVPLEPQWLRRLLPLQLVSGQALIDTGGEAGRGVRVRLAVESDLSAAWSELWTALLRYAAGIAGLAFATALGGTFYLRARLGPLDRALHQARALEQGRLQTVVVAGSGDAAVLARGMNAAIKRIEQGVAEHADRLMALQALAHADPVTGLANRRHFLGQFQTTVGGGLLLLRIRPLENLNARLGHAGADALLSVLAAVLRNYPERVAGALVGRLNGSDFALELPAPGLARETGHALAAAVRAAFANVGPEADVVIGGVDPLPPAAEPDRAFISLARADAALARAEAAGPFTVEIDEGPATAPVWGEREWRQRIRWALADPARHRLAEQAVAGSDGGLVHRACTLRLDLDPQGALGQGTEFAQAWAPHAARVRLLPMADLLAMELALQACARDGQPRALDFAAASLSTPGFVAEVTERLRRAARRDGALRLWIGLPEQTALEGSRLGLGEAASAWQGLGVRVGLSAAGGSPRNLGRLSGLGLDHVRIAPAHLAGAAGDPDIRQYAQGLIAFIHGMGCQAIAETIESPEDLRCLWVLGLDGASGRAAPSTSVA